MSSALAIAGVTAVIRDLLNDGLVNHNVAGVLGSSVMVSVGPPDRVVPANGTEGTQLNLFLHQVSPNAGWANEGLPSRDGNGTQRLSNAPLALNLHYLVSAYSAGDLHGEILLGYAMQLLHEMPVLSRQAIRTALDPSPTVGTALPPALRALVDSGLENQVEQIRITPEYLNTEEMSKLWTATQSHFRPTAAYVVSVVLIQATQPVRSPLPVLSRGPVDPLHNRERGVVVEPSLVPALPTLETVVPAGEQPVAVLGPSPIELVGHHLDGTGRTVLLANDRFDIDETIVASPSGGAGSVSFAIPTARAADFPVGVYRVGLEVLRPGDARPRRSNRLAMTLAPDIAGLPVTVVSDGGAASIPLTFSPALRAGQTVALVLGQDEVAPEPFATPTTALEFVIPDAPLGRHLVRLRVDGIDSPIIDRSVKPPTFLGRTVEIT